MPLPRCLLLRVGFPPMIYPCCSERYAVGPKACIAIPLTTPRTLVMLLFVFVGSLLRLVLVRTVSQGVQEGPTCQLLFSLYRFSRVNVESYRYSTSTPPPCRAFPHAVLHVVTDGSFYRRFGPLEVVGATHLSKMQGEECPEAHERCLRFAIVESMACLVR